MRPCEIPEAVSPSQRAVVCLQTCSPAPLSTRKLTFVPSFGGMADEADTAMTLTFSLASYVIALTAVLTDEVEYESSKHGLQSKT